MILTDSGHVYTVQASTINSYIVRLVYGISRRNHSVSRDMEELPIPCSTDEERVTMNGRPVDGSAVLQGNYLVNCNVHQTIHSYPHSDSGSLTTERSVRSDHSTADFGEAEDTTRQQQTSYVTPQNPTDTVLEEASSLVLPSLSSAPDSRQDSGVFSSLGSSLTRSDDHIISQEYHTYQPFYGMETLCRAMAYLTHRVTLNMFGGITFESVSSGTVTPIGNVKQMTVKLKTIQRKITGHCWHELHMGGWAIILPDDTEAERWMSHLDSILGALLDTKDYRGCQRNKDVKGHHSDSCQSGASQVTTTSKKCSYSELKSVQKKKEQQMYCALTNDVLLKYCLAEVINGSWRECSKCLELSDPEVHDIQSWYTSCVEMSYAVLDVFHEKCEKKSTSFTKDLEKRLSCLPQFSELRRVLNSTDHLCVRNLCPGVLTLQKVHEVPSATVCQLISCEHAIAAQWTKLARLLGLSRSQIDVIRLECHNRPQPCQQSAAKVLSMWSSGGTANSCSLATLLKVLKYMGRDLVVSRVVEHLHVSSAS